MTDNPNIVPEEGEPYIETVDPKDPPLTEEELPDGEDMRETERGQDIEEAERFGGSFRV